MPWSGEIEYRDDLLLPAQELKLDFTGKNPVWITGNALKLLRDMLKVSAVNLREDRVNWDKLGEPAAFYGEWRGFRGEDLWTKTLIKIRCHGKQGKDGFGNVTVWIRGFLLTTFKYGNPLELALWRAYNYSFYYKQRRAYLENSKTDLLSIRDKIREAYGILQEV